MTPRRVVYLALAIGRGHLMRAAILRRLLAPHGVQLDLVTTTDAGRRFLVAMGCPSVVLPGRFTLVYDRAQNLDRPRTAAALAAYLACPHRGLRDWEALQRLAKGADAIVNDSLHPAILAGPPSRVPVIAVHGEDLWEATEHPLALADPLAAWVAAGLRALRDRAEARIVHTLEPADPAPGEIRVPPILARPRWAPDEVRARLGLGSGERLAVAYLNPNFRDPALARAIEVALDRTGYRLYAVGEGYAGRPGWTARDPDLVDAVAAADLLVTAPGMGALAQARLFGVPLVAIVTDQPEQMRNVVRFARRDPVVALRPADPEFARDLARSAAELPARADRPDPHEAVTRLHATWTRAFLEALEVA